MAGWLGATVLGFLVLTGLIMALGIASTARYEADRDPAGPQVPGAESSDDRGSEAGGSCADAAPRAAGVAAGSQVGSAALSAAAIVPGGAVATLPARPAVEEAGQDKSAVGWWLLGIDCLDHPDLDIDIAGGRGCGSGARVVAGPFADELDADWAALPRGAPASRLVRVGYGVRRADGTLAGRPAPAELAWLAELGGQLGRLSGDWDALVCDTDPLTTLVVEVTAALTEAGLPLYDCSGPVPDVGSAGLAGGVLLAPHPAGHGILVGWRCHDRMSLHQVRGAATDTAVHSVMNAAVAGVLAAVGYPVQPYGSTGCHLLTAGAR